MNSDVDETLGLSRCSSATGTPDFEEITPYVSPALTIQNRDEVADVVVFAVVFVFFFFFFFVVVVVATRLIGVVGTWTALVELVPPASSPERMRRTATVAASRRCCGRRVPAPVVVTHYQPEAAQTSRLRRDASAPAASRKSVPVSRYA